MYLFYTPDLAGDLYTLNEEESRHCIKVLRLSKGDIIHLTDGRGNLYEAGIIEDKGKHCIVEIKTNLTETDRRQSTADRRKTFGFRPYRLHIAIAPTKNIDRFEWFLEKATEIGVDEITPVICEHSERRQIRTDRLEKVITSAVKQSLKAWHPKLNDTVEFRKFLPMKQDHDKFIAFITDGAPLLQNLYREATDATILIGPEGDFSKSEVELAIMEGYRVVSLGDSRLRTETAGIVACQTVYMISQA